MRARSESTAAYSLVAPAVTAIFLFFFVPVAAALLLSLTDFDIYALGDRKFLRFVGLDNYAHLLRDTTFWRALRNTAQFVVAAVPLSIGISLATALLLNHPLVLGRNIFRTVLFLPVVTTLVAVAVVWRYLYHPRYGLLNEMLQLFGLTPIDWLGDPHWAMMAIVIMVVWKNFGFNMVIFAAGLQAIPLSLYEAARLDGANGWQQFRYVTLPMLRPTFAFVTVITLIGYFQLFAEPYILTPTGGPELSTLSIVLYMYQEGFRWWNLGYAATIAVVLFVILLLTTWIQTWVERRI